MIQAIQKPVGGAGRREFVSVQYLRALAALLVVCHHAGDQVRGSVGLYDVGNAGVDLFFVISGFIMVAITDARPMPAPIFLLRRWLRIWPIYAFFTLLTALGIVLIPHAFEHSVFTVKHLLLSLAFITHPEPNNATQISPLLKIGWTLNYEMFFYVMFALCLWLGGRFRVLMLGTILAALVAAGKLWPPASRVAAFYEDPIVLEFLFGALIGVLLRGRRAEGFSRYPLLVAMALGVVLCCCLPAEWHRSVRFGIGAALLLFGAVAYERNFGMPQLRFVHQIGDSSYSLYLVHLYPVIMLRELCVAMDVPIGYFGGALFIVAAAAAATGAGFWSYWLVERPTIAWGHALVKRIWKQARLAPA
jgi:exopolysaccharide production protein ExoZ